MYSDSNIAKKFQLGQTKCGYFKKFVIAPYFLDLLYKEILLSPVFVISFDESLNNGPIFKMSKAHYCTILEQ